MKIVNYINTFLTNHKIEYAFGVSGANIEDLFYELQENSNINIILAKNEYNAVMMAIGYYLKHKKMAAVLTTSGAGVLNTIAPLCEAYESRIPLILISGMPPSSLEGKGAFQDTSGKNGSINLQNILKECTADTITTSFELEHLPLFMHDTYHLALRSQRPMALLVNKDHFQKEIISSLKEIPFKEQMEELLHQEKEILFEIKKSKDEKILVLGEELLTNYDKNLIITTAKILNAKIVTTPSTKGLNDIRNSLFLGSIGVMGDDKAIRAYNLSPCIILLGTKFDILTQIGLNSHSINKSYYYIGERETFFEDDNLKSLHISPNVFFSELTKEQDENTELNSFDHKKTCKIELDQNLNFINTVQIFNHYLNPENDIFVDAGNTGAYFSHYLKTYGESLFYISVGMGGMGNTMGAAIGATVSSKNRSYVFIGDGSFLIQGLEIHTAIEHQLPITFVILNNNSHGMCEVREKLYFEKRSGFNHFTPANYGKGLNEMFKNLQAYDVDDTTTLQEILSETHNQNSTILISLNIHDDLVPPFRTFIKEQE